ncbi:hypothetical protein EMIHUDRAFT_201047 [Emiliania huxleyi CCMP1516]|uniref:TLC domain-containing protein n=2 Tax=Emiliania huxleyi TaxID=2903 RepID=A0A0D3KM25_EMIH1|nr:hypothetical protein EMIHUDRAFT_201047 [Emiliania huxleyi CCMP1516]EOD36810.1 hypothetical protein EMIHUDRAFT_201047 [Emiliania huxleyi CCMP1516]|eukprot:XP_005789239.1 hypothetical protein EMIHUDRAFT_201047 [Emiliania huxleyi CCMP1516]
MYESACGSRTIADYPGWSWLASLWHGLLAMPILVSATVLLLPTTTAGVDGFLREGWERMPWPLEHVHYAIFGYMLKDFVLYPAGIELGYLVHHLITIAGCTLCLHLPAGAALTTLNGAQAEVSSSLFSVRHVWPSPPTRLLYYLSMSASNALGALLALRLADIDTLPRSLTTAYAGALLLDLADWVGGKAGGKGRGKGGAEGGEGQPLLGPFPPGLGYTPKSKALHASRRAAAGQRGETGLDGAAWRVASPRRRSALLLDFPEDGVKKKLPQKHYGIKPAWFASTAKAKTDTRPYTNAVLRLDSTGCVSMYAAPIAVASNVFPSIRFEVVAHATKFAPSLPAPASALNHFTQSS